MATLRDSSKLALTVGVFCLSLASVSGIVTYTHTRMQCLYTYLFLPINKLTNCNFFSTNVNQLDGLTQSEEQFLVHLVNLFEKDTLLYCV